MSPCPTLALCIVISFTSLSGGCSRDASSPAERSSTAATVTPRDPWASGGTRSGDELTTKELIEEAKLGLGALAARERATSAVRDKQIATLDDKLAAIQRLLIAGNYDEAEIRLVDIYWKPVEAGTDHDNQLVRQYDEKRAALTAILQRKRAAAPAPAR